MTRVTKWSRNLRCECGELVNDEWSWPAAGRAALREAGYGLGRRRHVRWKEWPTRKRCRSLCSWERILKPSLGTHALMWGPRAETAVIGKGRTEKPRDWTLVTGGAKGDSYGCPQSGWAVSLVASCPLQLLTLVRSPSLAFLILPPPPAGGIWLGHWRWVFRPWWQWRGLAFASQELGVWSLEC